MRGGGQEDPGPAHTCPDRPPPCAWLGRTLSLLAFGFSFCKMTWRVRLVGHGDPLETPWTPSLRRGWSHLRELVLRRKRLSFCLCLSSPISMPACAPFSPPAQTGSEARPLEKRRETAPIWNSGCWRIHAQAPASSALLAGLPAANEGPIRHVDARQEGHGTPRRPVWCPAAPRSGELACPRQDARPHPPAPSACVRALRCTRLPPAPAAGKAEGMSRGSLQPPRQAELRPDRHPVHLSLGAGLLWGLRGVGAAGGRTVQRSEVATGPRRLRHTRGGLVNLEKRLGVLRTK